MTSSSSSSSSTKVAVLGAGGGIGQPLSMLLKLSPVVDELACYDIVGAPGVAADLAHVSFIQHSNKLRKLHWWWWCGEFEGIGMVGLLLTQIAHDHFTC